MKHCNVKTIALFLTLALTAAFSPGIAGDAERTGRLDLSPELIVLLKAEMNELSSGIGEIALSLAKADWETLEITSGKMHDSYIMKKSLTPAMAAELSQKLPPGFKQLDTEFHARALKLQQSAGARDLELTAFHFSRLVENCTSCHTAYAAERFPGFKKHTKEQHEH